MSVVVVPWLALFAFIAFLLCDELSVTATLLVVLNVIPPSVDWLTAEDGFAGLEGIKLIPGPGITVRVTLAVAVTCACEVETQNRSPKTGRRNDMFGFLFIVFWE